MIKKLILISLMFLFVACQPSTTTTPLPVPTKTPGPPTYYVNKSTGLYEVPEIDSKMIETLSEGAKVIPADGAESLSCTSFSDSGTTYNLCRVVSKNTGNTGWVLIQWIDRQEFNN